MAPDFARVGDTDDFFASLNPERSDYKNISSGPKCQLSEKILPSKYSVDAPLRTVAE